MRVTRIVNCCGSSVEVIISKQDPYVCPNCGKVYTLKNTSHPRYDPDNNLTLLEEDVNIVATSFIF